MKNELMFRPFGDPANDQILFAMKPVSEPGVVATTAMSGPRAPFVRAYERTRRGRQKERHSQPDRQRTGLGWNTTQLRIDRADARHISDERRFIEFGGVASSCASAATARNESIVAANNDIFNATEKRCVGLPFEPLEWNNRFYFGKARAIPGNPDEV